MTRVNLIFSHSVNPKPSEIVRLVMARGDEMDERTLQKKLNQLVKIANELGDEARRRWPNGHLFFEAEGTFHLMSGDCDGLSRERQGYVEASSSGYCTMSAGAW